VILALEGGYPNISREDMIDGSLEFKTATSYLSQAIRKVEDRDEIPLTHVGLMELILTSDNKYVYGLRDGKVGTGRIGISPSRAIFYHLGDEEVFSQISITN
jgi:hypothetical protein|tara:strand:+ start:10609 stop:10914 length:306 start_codon:yes stop_codon:yes gene_type:complete